MIIFDVMMCHVKTIPNAVLFLLLILACTFTLQHLPHMGKELMSYHVCCQQWL